MNKIVAVLGFVTLSACMGSGGGGGPQVTQSQPDIATNNEMGTILNNARSSTLPGLEYNSVVGTVAQNHAQDMVNRNYLSTFDQGTTGFAGPRGGEADMGDDLNALNRRWDEIVQMVAQGDKASTQALFDEFLARTSASTDANGNIIEGDIGDKLQAALDTDVDFEFFGLGKAGSGSNQKWALIVVDPDSSWTDR